MKRAAYKGGSRFNLGQQVMDFQGLYKGILASMLAALLHGIGIATHLVADSAKVLGAGPAPLSIVCTRT